MEYYKDHTWKPLPDWLIKELALRPLPDPGVAEPFEYLKADFFRCLDQMADIEKKSMPNEIPK